MEKKTKESTPPPNVAFVGKELRKNERGEQEMLPALNAPELFNTANSTIKIASSETQVSGGAKGFYDENADWLIMQFPHLYKRPVSKGE